jgi:hypothetical protein
MDFQTEKGLLQKQGKGNKTGNSISNSPIDEDVTTMAQLLVACVARGHETTGYCRTVVIRFLFHLLDEHIPAALNDAVIEDVPGPRIGAARDHAGVVLRHRHFHGGHAGSEHPGRRRAHHLRQEPPGRRQHRQLRVPVLDAELDRGGHHLYRPAGGNLDSELRPEHHLAAASLGVPVLPEHVGEPDAGRLRSGRVHVRPPEAPLRKERRQRGAAELLGLQDGCWAHGRRGALRAVQEPRLRQRHRRHGRPRGREHGSNGRGRGRRRVPRGLRGSGGGRGGLSHESSSLLGTNRPSRSATQHRQRKGVPVRAGHAITNHVNQKNGNFCVTFCSVVALKNEQRRRRGQKLTRKRPSWMDQLRQ